MAAAWTLGQRPRKVTWQRGHQSTHHLDGGGHRHGTHSRICASAALLWQEVAAGRVPTCCSSADGEGPRPAMVVTPEPSWALHCIALRRLLWLEPEKFIVRWRSPVIYLPMTSVRISLFPWWHAPSKTSGQAGALQRFDIPRRCVTRGSVSWPMGSQFIAGGPHTSATASAAQEKHFVWGPQQSLGHPLSRANLFRVGPLQQVGTHEICHNQQPIWKKGRAPAMAWTVRLAVSNSSCWLQRGIFGNLSACFLDSLDTTMRVRGSSLPRRPL